MATVHFNKRPDEKNLRKRSLAFQEYEIKNIEESDLVEIVVYDPSNVRRYTINMTGDKFLLNIEDKGKFLILKF